LLNTCSTIGHGEHLQLWTQSENVNSGHF